VTRSIARSLCDSWACCKWVYVSCCLFAAVTSVKLWALSRHEYQQILTFSGLRIHHQRLRFLQRSFIYIVFQKIAPPSCCCALQ